MPVFWNYFANNVLNRFQHFIEKSIPGINTGKNLLAISGGADSVAMGWLFYKSGYAFDVVHVNFGLRGQESDDDEAFVRSLCRQWDVKCHVKKADTRHVAKSLGASVQMAARQIRYDYFEELRLENGYHLVCTAHQQDDNLEHLFVYLLRNSDAAWKGIPVIKNGIARPMLFAKASEIRNWLTGQGQQWREDSSNHELYYLRNKVRHLLMPLLHAEFPESLEEFFDLSREYSAYRQQKVNKMLKWADNYRHGEKAGWFFDNQADRLYLSEFLAVKGMKPPEIKKCLDATASGGVHYFEDFAIEVRTEGLWVVKTGQSVNETICLNRSNLPAEMKWGSYLLNLDEIDPNAVNFAQPDCWFAESEIAFPILIRAFQHGDRMQPMGMNGSKKISDVLTDARVPNMMKSGLPLLESPGGILGIIPLRRSKTASLNEETKKVLRIQWKFMGEDDSD